jgi:tripartite-type tricarboxylate transporter receptor subunit TctC
MIRRCYAACFSALALAGVVCAQDYPSRPIHMLAGDVGSNADFVARLIAQGISMPLGKPVVVDNRSALIATETLANSAPDGYTIFFSGSVPWVTPLLQKTSYDPMRDFAPVTLATITPFVLVVHPSLPAKSVKELIALAKAKPGELNYSSAVTGGGIHLAGELFKGMAGLDIVRINYTASGGVNAVVSGESQLMFDNPPPVMVLVKTGKLRALAVTSARPSAVVPGLPTVAATLPGYEYEAVYGVLARAGTPPAIIRRLNQEVVRVLNRPDIREKLLNEGVEAVGSTPEEFAGMIKSDMQRFGKVLTNAGINSK